MSLLREALEKSGRRTAAPENAQAPTKLPIIAPVTIEERQAEEEKIVRILFPKSTWKKRALITLAILFLIGLSANMMVSYFSTKPVFLREPVPEAMVTVAPVKPGAERIIPDYVLSGITSVNGKPVALIDNEIYGVGDYLNGDAKVVSIARKSVLLQIRDQQKELAL